MPRNISRTISLAFIIFTLISTTGMIYSFNFYFEVYTAIRTITTSISEFNVEISDTSAHTETTLVLNNTSSQQFYVIGVEMRVYLNGEFFDYTRTETPSLSHPLLMSPHSNLNIAITADLPLSPETLELLLQDTQKNWFTTIRIRLDGPILGKFWMSAQGSFTRVARGETT